MTKPKPPAEPRAPSNPVALRIGGIFGRRTTTKWLPREIQKYLALLPIDEQELLMLERYYKANWPPRHGHNILRTDLVTLLNNWNGEVDRAKIWCAKHPVRNKIIKFPSPEPVQAQEWTEAERVKAAEQLEKLRRFRGVT